MASSRSTRSRRADHAASEAGGRAVGPQPRAPRPAPLSELQATIGNRALGGLLGPGADRGRALERDADRLAARVAQGSKEATPTRVPSPGGDVERPLSTEERAFYEPRLGASLGEVRLRSGPRAAEEARALRARAFAVGPRITFGEGQLDHDTVAGRHLMAHEMAHVLQQRRGQGQGLVQRAPENEDDDDFGLHALPPEAAALDGQRFAAPGPEGGYVEVKLHSVFHELAVGSASFGVEVDYDAKKVSVFDAGVAGSVKWDESGETFEDTETKSLLDHATGEVERIAPGATVDVYISHWNSDHYNALPRLAAARRLGIIHLSAYNAQFPAHPDLVALEAISPEHVFKRVLQAQQELFLRDGIQGPVDTKVRVVVRVNGTLRYVDYDLETFSAKDVYERKLEQWAEAKELPEGRVEPWMGEKTTVRAEELLRTGMNDGWGKGKGSVGEYKGEIDTHGLHTFSRGEQGVSRLHDPDTKAKDMLDSRYELGLFERVPETTRLLHLRISHHVGSSFGISRKLIDLFLALERLRRQEIGLVVTVSASPGRFSERIYKAFQQARIPVLVATADPSSLEKPPSTETVRLWSASRGGAPEDLYSGAKLDLPDTETAFELATQELLRIEELPAADRAQQQTRRSLLIKGLVEAIEGQFTPKAAEKLNAAMASRPGVKRPATSMQRIGPEGTTLMEGLAALQTSPNEKTRAGLQASVDAMDPDTLEPGDRIAYDMATEALRGATRIDGMDPKTGALTTTDVLLQKAHGATEKGFGVLVLASAVHGLYELDGKPPEDQLEALHDVLGMTASVYGLHVGVRMLQAVPVGRGAFYLLVALEVATTGTDDYDDEAARRAALATAMLRGALGLAVMELASLMMGAGWPGLAAGVLTLVGWSLVEEPVLEGLGVFDLIERATADRPASVTRVRQKLRDFHELAQAPERDPLALAGAERDFGAALQVAYAEVPERGTHLLELDALRAEFVRLRFQLHGGIPPTAAPPLLQPSAASRVYVPAPTRRLAAWALAEAPRVGFQSLASAEEVQGLALWSETDATLEDLEGRIRSTGLTTEGDGFVDWEAVREATEDAARGLAEMHHLLGPDPRLRTSSIVAAGSEAEPTARAELERRRERLAGLALGPSATTGPARARERSSAATATTLLDRYEAALDQLRGLDSRTAQVPSYLGPDRWALGSALLGNLDPQSKRFPEQVQAMSREAGLRDDQAEALRAIEVAATAFVDSTLWEQREDPRPDDELQALQLSLRLQSLRSRRIHRYGVIFPDERPQSLLDRQQVLSESLAEAIGGSQALERIDTLRLHTITRAGTPRQLARIHGRLLVGTLGGPLQYVGEDELVIVGLTGKVNRMVVEWVEVVALSPDAVDKLGPDPVYVQGDLRSWVPR